jgi:uncharacterized cupredoxin-like copper-binding protein
MARKAGRSMAAMAVIALVAAACGGGGGGNSVKATAADFTITLDSSTAKAGEVTFSITNDGPSVHEFVVFRTDLAADQLPTTEDENGIPIVDEEGEGVEHVDEVEDIAVNATQELKVTLTAGTYVVLCNLPAHYQQGMHATLTVSS